MGNICFSCQHCDLRFPLAIGLQQHLKKHLSKSKLCLSASLVEQLKQQQQQQQQQMEIDQQEVIDLENDDQSSLLCPFCDKLFKNLEPYYLHLKNHSVDNSSNRGHSETNLSDGKSLNWFYHVYKVDIIGCQGVEQLGGLILGYP